MSIGSESAFPRSETLTQIDTIDYPGLTKRELFAAMALQGMISNHLVVPHFKSSDYETYAKGAISHADALLAELERTNG